MVLSAANARQLWRSTQPGEESRARQLRDDDLDLRDFGAVKLKGQPAIWPRDLR